MSHFTVLVIGEDPEAQLAPFHEFECTGHNDEYVQDVDITAEVQKRIDGYREEWEGDKEPKIDEETGKPVDPLTEALSFHGLEDRIVEDASQVQTQGHKAPHMYGYAIVKDGKLIKAVDRTNPEKHWDWYVLGGRWTGFFKLKPGATGFTGRPGTMMEPNRDPEWCDQAKKKDIDFEGMMAHAAQEGREHWRKVRACVGDTINTFVNWNSMLKKHGIDPEAKFSKESAEAIDAARVEYHKQDAIEKLRTDADKDMVWVDLEHYLCTEDEYAQERALAAVSTFAVIKDGKWYERGSMGWWGVVHGEKERDDWMKEFNKLLTGLPPDTLLSVFDCHI